MKTYRYLDLIMALFVTVLLVSNIASSAKIVDWGLNLFGVPLAFDAGTLLFPISYIFGDILTEVYGYRASRRVIWAGFFSLALAAGVFALVGTLPGEAQWQQYAGDAAYRAILGGISSGGIVLASLMAYWAGEFSNSFTLAKLKVLTRGRWLWLRTLSSTLIGQLVDTVVFVVIASRFGVFPWGLFLTLTVTNYLFKVGVEAIMTPVTYAVVGALKRLEHEDFYDRETNFNPFRL
ncbi:MAG: queuosine precursor transporter [Anaerolineales bacterium]|nr:queuosine precursor transporter [Anaerolineales bacterium]MDW8228176.1 queuosine precursor transporter [Anaerolineales bacterium]